MVKNKVCKRCHKTYAEDKFYRTRKDSQEYEDDLLPVCKTCMENNFKASDPNTFMHYLKALDIPWIPSEYRSIYNKNVKPSAPNSIAIFGKYIMKMKLKQFSQYNFFDSQEAQEKLEAPENYDSIENYNYNLPLDKVVFNPVKENNFHLEEVELSSRPAAETMIDQALLDEIDEENANRDNVNVTSHLTRDDLKYLILKWGRAYSTEQLITLEISYLEMCEDFDIRTSTEKNYLKKYCKASMRYEENLDSLDFANAQKVSSMFTNINKEAGFQPIQNKGQDDDYLNSVSFLVKLAESKGPIGKDLFKEYLDYPEDIVDLSIKDIKKWQRDLVRDDDTIMDRFAIAKQELEKQDALVNNGEVGSDNEEEDLIKSIDMNFYEDLEDSPFEESEFDG